MYQEHEWGPGQIGGFCSILFEGLVVDYAK